MKNRAQFFFQNDLIGIYQQGGRKKYHQRFLWSKRELVGKTNLSLKIFAAAFGIEMPHLEMILKLMGVHMVVVMSQTMLAEQGGVAETGHQVMVFRAKVKVDIQPKGHKQHVKCHQNASDLKDFSFHGANIKKFLNFAVSNNIT